jgi:hypothetical protein
MSGLIVRDGREVEVEVEAIGFGVEMRDVTPNGISVTAYEILSGSEGSGCALSAWFDFRVWIEVLRNRIQMPWYPIQLEGCLWWDGIEKRLQMSFGIGLLGNDWRCVQESCAGKEFPQPFRFNLLLFGFSHGFPLLGRNDCFKCGSFIVVINLVSEN